MSVFPSAVENTVVMVITGGMRKIAKYMSVH